MLVDDIRTLDIFIGLTDEQLAELVEAGTEVAVQPGVDLFQAGDRADFWWVLVDGAIDLIRHAGREDTVVGRLDAPGRWAGGFRAWDEHGVYLATGRGRVTGRVLRVPSDVLREKTNAWFPLAGHLVAGLYRTARSIESTVRQGESLVTLGQLVAGFAHELNNPAAAATRAVADLEISSQTLLASLDRLAREEITAEQFSALDALRREIVPQPRAALDPLVLSDREDALSRWISDHGIDRGWILAPPLAEAGAGIEWCERVAAVVGEAGLGPGLEWLASTFSVAALLSEVKASTRRISELVAAAKSYSQMDRESMQQTDVTEGIESTLVVLGHKLRNGLKVVRDYGADVPKIEAYPAELNQVWTNLIDNAIEVMGGSGELRLSTRADQDAVVVEIGDNGPGMPAHVAARAFEPFFTTKDVGKGTGLGLDIARRIVEERHGGTITIDSHPGETILRVRLPARRPT